MNLTSSLPSYTVQQAPRGGKGARLKFSAQDGLIVVVPRGFDEARIPALLEGKRRWLEEVTARFAAQRRFLEPEPPGHQPERILLRSVGQEWSLTYRQTRSEIVSATPRDEQRLLVFGDIENEIAVKAALNRWLGRRAHEHLAPWARRLADEKGLPIARVLIKSQRTRWASCSARGNLSLNVRLLFLPEPLVRYVMLHELAHTREMNHSKRFWAIVAGLEPDYQRLDEELRTAWRLVPAWLRVASAIDAK